jgi:hypothetical protein
MGDAFWEAFEPYVRTILFVIVFGGIPLYALVISCRLYPRIFEASFPASSAPRRSGRTSGFAEDADTDTDITLAPRLEILGGDATDTEDVRPRISGERKTANVSGNKLGPVER